jgi:protein-S-isoprenylcysteine O-methyltransferase Ste14
VGTESWTDVSSQVSQPVRQRSDSCLADPHPALWILYFLCAAIRSNVSLSLTMNSDVGHSLRQKLDLTDKQVSTGVALFYVCYVVFDAPANLIMTRLSPHVWMSRIVICVAIIGCCHAALSAAWNF